MMICQNSSLAHPSTPVQACTLGMAPPQQAPSGSALTAATDDLKESASAVDIKPSQPVCRAAHTNGTEQRHRLQEPH